MSSARASAPNPHTTPRPSAVSAVGFRAKRYARRSASTTASTLSVSDMTSPSFTHRLGYTAAIPAATRPARSPATARPRRPMRTTPTVPSNAIVSRCALGFHPLIHETGASTMIVRGG